MFDNRWFTHVYTIDNKNGALESNADLEPPEKRNDYNFRTIELNQLYYSYKGNTCSPENGSILEFKMCEGDNKEQAEVLMNEYEIFLDDIGMTNKSLITALKYKKKPFNKWLWG